VQRRLLLDDAIGQGFVVGAVGHLVGDAALQILDRLLENTVEIGLAGEVTGDAFDL